MYIYSCIHAYIHTCIYTNIYIHLYLFIYASTHIHILTLYACVSDTHTLARARTHFMHAHERARIYRLHDACVNL